MIGTAHLENVPVAVIGPTTAEAVRQAGLKPSVVSPSPTADSLIGSLEAFFAQQSP
jgi:uroporphyrinogen-III synthase